MDIPLSEACEYRLELLSRLDGVMPTPEAIAAELLEQATDDACTKQALIARIERMGPERATPARYKHQKKRKKSHKCRFCGKKLSGQGVRMHERFCTQNPNRRTRGYRR